MRASTEVRPVVPIETLSGPDFYADLLQDIAASEAGDQISATTMSFNPNDPIVSRVMHEFGEAANRQVTVRLGVDAYALLLESTSPIPGPLWAPLPFGQRQFHKRQQELDALDSQPGASVRIINTPSRPFSNPAAGRSHLKWFVINNKIYVPNGNLNLTHDSDMTLAFEDETTAQWLHNITTGLLESGSTRETLGNQDQVRPIDATTDCLLDAGVPGQSVVLDEALRVINEAEEWLILTTQYFPRDAVLRPLVKACMRGVDVRLPFNDPTSQGLVEKLPERFALSRSRKLAAPLMAGRLPARAQKMHIKALANEKEAIGGNHNLDPRGVNYGTAELGIHRKDPEFALALADFALLQAGQAPLGKSAANSGPII